MAKFPHVYADLGYSPLAADAQFRLRYSEYLRRELLPLKTVGERTTTRRDRTRDVASQLCENV
jgi:hypothetical protein